VYKIPTCKKDSALYAACINNNYQFFFVLNFILILQYICAVPVFNFLFFYYTLMGSLITLLTRKML
jgi:hypothetical protein